MMKLKLVFELNSPNWCINSGVPAAATNSTFTFALDKVSLRVKRVKLMDSLCNKFESTLLSKNCLFPYSHKSVKSHSIPAGARHFYSANIFNQPFLPKYAFFMLVRASAAAGNFRESGLAFEPFGLKDIALFVQNKRIPSIPYNLDYTSTNKKFLAAWTQLFGNDSSFADVPCQIQRSEFCDEKNLYAFWMNKNVGDGESFSMPMASHASLNMEFSTDQNPALRLYCYMSNEVCLEITHSREVVVNFTL